MKTITYNPETHVLVPREPSEEMQAAMEAQWEAGSYVDMAKREWGAAIAAAPQPEPVDVEPAMWVMKHIRSGDLTQAEPNQKALHPYMWSDAFPRYTTPQPEFGCACDLSVGYLCGPCHADKLRAELAEKDEVIAEAGEMLAMRDRQLAALKAENESLRKDAERH